MSKSMTPFSNVESNFGSIMEEKQVGDTVVMDGGLSANPVEQPLSISQVELESTIVESEPANAKDNGGFSNIDHGSDEEDSEPSPMTPPSDGDNIEEANDESPYSYDSDDSDDSDKAPDIENFSQNAYLKYLVLLILFLILAITIYYLYPYRVAMLFPDTVSYFTKFKV